MRGCGDIMKDIYNLGLNEFPGMSFQCDCGRVHTVDIKNILIGKNNLVALGELLKDFIGKEIFIVEDKNTYEAAGSKVEKLLKRDFKIKKFIFKDEHLIPDEKALGRMLVEIPENTAVIVAVGSGSINDIARFLSYKLNIPYVVVCTAPSMDGYASVVSPLVVDNVKTTYSAVYPYAIIGDIEIMKKAPMYMLHAGFGDILGKYTALADWHLAQELKNEYFCEPVEKLVLKAVDKCVKASEKIKDRDTEAIESITEALILSGMAIGMTGTSRPASGEEHHLSHCWEMVFMNAGKETKWLHGNNVGVGVGIILEAYKYVSQLDIDKVYSLGNYKYLSNENWRKTLTEVYGRSAENIINSKENDIAFGVELREKNMKKIKDHWNNIKDICSSLPSPEAVKAIMEKSETIYDPSELGIDRELFKMSFMAAKDVRRRYGVLQLLEDIGMLEEASEVITKIYYK